MFIKLFQTFYILPFLTYFPATTDEFRVRECSLYVMRGEFILQARLNVTEDDRVGGGGAGIFESLHKIIKSQIW